MLEVEVGSWQVYARHLYRMHDMSGLKVVRTTGGVQP
jgi:hypothetical protein